MPEPFEVPVASKLVAELLATHALPCALKPNPDDHPADEVKRATMTLLRLPQRDVCLTCFHVWRGLERMRKVHQDADLVAYYLLVPKNIVELRGFTFLDGDERSLDVAIFAGVETRIELPGLRFIDYNSSYLHDPVPGDLVSIVGYPRENVSVSRKVANFGIFQAAFTASSVSERQIVLADEHGTHGFIDHADPSRRGIKLGGLSGSPAFVFRDKSPRFVGVVTDGEHSSSPIIVSRLGCIKPDGTLDHGLIPW